MTIKTIRNLGFALIFTAWAVSMALLVSKHYRSPSPPASSPEAHMQTLPEHLFREQWMGVYMRGRKVGYTSTLLSPVEEGYDLRESIAMRMNLMGQSREVEVQIQASLTHKLHLRAFDARMSGDAKMQIRGELKGQELHLNISAQGATGNADQARTETIIIPLVGDPSFGNMLIARLASGGLKVGEEITMPVVDPLSFGVNSMSVKVEALEEIISMGRAREAYRLSGSMGGMDFTSWVSPDGEVFKQETSLGFTFIVESQEVAQSMDAPSEDMIYAFRVPFNLELPEGVRHLRLKLLGVETDTLELDGGTQSYEGGVLTITAIGESGEGGAGDLPGPGPLEPGLLEPGLLERFTAPSTLVQSDSAEIMALAREITGDERNTLKRLRMLHDWVYENIEKTPAITVPSALEVLASMRGDCNEHTTLFTALARASGIPTRMATGLVYMGDGFYYHAWPEVYVKGWMPLDPTLGQFPADAAHVRLLTGGLTSQAGIIGVMGRIELEGLEYK